jgi:tRNA threonylcarbamoyladenosine biosynthesis protein TsaB
MIVLASDTSTKKAHFALLENEIVRAEAIINNEKKHGETFVHAIEGLLSMIKREIEEVDLFVTTVGPGSFTGIRVGVSALKGLAFALDKPLVGVSTLETLAMNVPDPSITVCPMVDARRDEVYTALYRFNGEEKYPEKTGDERAVAPAEFLEDIKGDIVFLGDGAIRYEELIRKTVPKRSFFVPSCKNDIKAGAAGLLGLHKFRRGDFVDAALLKPRYLRLSYAEMKR